MPTTNQPLPTRYTVTVVPGGRAKYAGVDRGGFGTVIAENDRALVIRWPGGTHWVGRGIRSYHPASTDVLHKEQDGKYSLLISWDTGRSDKQRTTKADDDAGQAKR
jgi:hypothetical protein